MEITDVRVKLIEEPNDRLKAVCSVTFDGEFVVRDIKVVEGAGQGLFVAMPSRKLSAHCPRCKAKNHLRAKFCNECGSKLPPQQAPSESNGRTRLHCDIAHPLNTAFREGIQAKVIEAFRGELELAQKPGYEPRDLDAEAEPEEAAPSSSGEFDANDYDALIAGLRGGGHRDEPSEPTRQHASRRDDGRRAEASRERKEPQQPSQPGRRDGGQARGRGRRRAESKGQSQSQGRSASQGRPQDRPETRPSPAPVKAPPPPPPPIVEGDETPFGAGLL
ncbi:MAG: SpoVG family protein [Planctomycetota bacterium]